MFKMPISIFLCFLLCQCSWFSKDRYVNTEEGTDLFTENPDLARFPLSAQYVPFNTKLTLLESGKNYSRVQFETQTGWVCSTCIDRDEPERNRYINSIKLVSLLSAAPDGNEIAILENNEPLEILTTFRPPAANVFSQQVWARVKTSKGIGWVRNRAFGLKKKDFFFFVSAYSGLNLREGPSLNSKIIKLMPFSTTGQILKRENSEVIIDSKKGFWFKALHEGTTGYVFSGFTLVSDNLDSLQKSLEATGEVGFKKFLDQYLDVNVLTEAEFQAMKLKFPRESRTETRYFEIISLSSLVADQCDQGERERVIFRNKKHGTYYHVGGGLIETIVSQGSPYPDTVTTLTHHCICCCPWTENRTYFLMQDELKVLSFSLGKESGNGTCNFGPVVYYSWGQEYKRVSDKEIMGHLLFPNCADEIGEHDLGVPGMGSFASKTFRHELFLKLDFDPERNLINIQKTYEGGIPEQYRQVWESVGSVL